MEKGVVPLLFSPLKRNVSKLDVFCEPERSEKAAARVLFLHQTRGDRPGGTRRPSFSPPASPGKGSRGGCRGRSPRSGRTTTPPVVWSCAANKGGSDSRDGGRKANRTAVIVVVPPQGFVGFLYVSTPESGRQRQQSMRFVFQGCSPLAGGTDGNLPGRPPPCRPLF